MLRHHKAPDGGGGARADTAFQQSHDQLWSCNGGGGGAPAQEDSFSALTQAFGTRLSELQQLVCLRIEGAS